MFSENAYDLSRCWDALTLKEWCMVLTCGMGTRCYIEYDYRAAPPAMKINLVLHLNVHDDVLVMISLEHNGAKWDKSHPRLLLHWFLKTTMGNTLHIHLSTNLIEVRFKNEPRVTRSRG